MKAYAIKKYARKQKCGLLFEPFKWMAIADQHQAKTHTTVLKPNAIFTQLKPTASPNTQFLRLKNDKSEYLIE